MRFWRKPAKQCGLPLGGFMIPGVGPAFCTQKYKHGGDHLSEGERHYVRWAELPQGGRVVREVRAWK